MREGLLRQTLVLTQALQVFGKALPNIDHGRKIQARRRSVYRRSETLRLTSPPNRGLSTVTDRLRGESCVKRLRDPGVMGVTMTGYGKIDGDSRTFGTRERVTTAEQLSEMQFRYIKLGPNGRWSAKAIEEQVLFLGHKEVPHDLALRGDKKELAAFLQGICLRYRCCTLQHTASNSYSNSRCYKPVDQLQRFEGSLGTTSISCGMSRPTRPSEI